VIHLSPDAGPVDVFADGGAAPVLSAVPFLAGSPYLDLPVGSHTFDVAPAGSGIGASVLSATVDVAVGASYSAAAIGNVGGGTLSALALVDDATGLASTDTRLQITHAADGVGQVDLWNLDTATPILQDVDYGATASVDVPSGTLWIGLDANDDGAADYAFSVPELGGGVFADVYAVLDGGAPALAAHLPDGTVAVVRRTPRPRSACCTPPPRPRRSTCG
jgi:hypothetical protein